MRRRCRCRQRSGEGNSSIPPGVLWQARDVGVPTERVAGPVPLVVVGGLLVYRSTSRGTFRTGEIDAEEFGDLLRMLDDSD